MVEHQNPYVLRVNSERAPFWETVKPVLGHLDMELTERCNNNCIHCCVNLPAQDAGARRRELSTQDIQSILEEAASLGCLTVRFTGGEPLLREDFEELYLDARKRGLKVLLFTNATLLSTHLADLFSLVPPLEPIEISVYGMKKSSCDAITGNAGSFEAARKGIGLLLERKVPFVVKSAWLNPNKEEVEELETWVSTIPWMDGPPSYSVFFDLHCRRDERRNAGIRKIRPDPQEGLAFLAGRKSRYMKELKDFCGRFIRPPGHGLFSCGAGVGGGCVDAYGFFHLCMDLKHPRTAYDLNKGSLNEALTKFFPEVRHLKAENADYLARCARCFLKGLCEQCPAKSWAEHGTMDTPVEYLCEVAHAEARSAGLLGYGEIAWEVVDWEKRVGQLSANQAGK